MKEVWKDIIGYEGLYQVSNLGRIKSLAKNRNSLQNGDMLLKPSINKKGYLIVRLYKNTVSKDFPVHRLVANMFIDNPSNKREVNHINGVKHDNRMENLEWCTGSENVRHAFEIGINTPRKGTLNGMAKLNDAKVLEIKVKYSEGNTAMRKLALEYGVDYALIQRIIKGTSWSHIKMETNGMPY